MSEGETKRDSGGVQEALRAAVQRTIAVAAETAATTRERAQGLAEEPSVGGLQSRARELLDEVARRGVEASENVTRRGQGARDEVARRGQEAREGVARRGQRTRDGLSRIRVAGADEVRALGARLDELEGRLERMEAALRTGPAQRAEPRQPTEPAEPKGKPES